MKLNVRKMLSTVWIGYVELLLVLPALLFVHQYVIQENIFWLWLFLLGICYGIGYILWTFWPPHKMSWCHLVATGIALLISVLLFDVSFTGIISVAIMWLVITRGGMYTVFPLHVLLPVNFYMFSITIYLFTSILARMNFGRLAVEVDVLHWGAIGTIAVTLFMMNLYVIEQESALGERGRTAGRNVRWKNRLLIGGFALITVIIASFKSFMNAVSNLASSIVAWLWSLFTSDGRDHVNTEHPITAIDTDRFHRTQDTPFWNEWFIQSGKWVVMIGVIVIAYLFIRLVLRRLKKILDWARLRYFRFGDEGSEEFEYEDEVKRLADWQDLRERWRDAILSRFARVNADSWERQQDNIARIRYLYRVAMSYILQDGYRYNPSLTPRETKKDADRWRGRETLPETLVYMYEEARYGGKEPTDEQVITMKRRLMG